MDTLHAWIDPLCRATVEMDPVGPCSAAKVILVVGAHVVVFWLVRLCYGPMRRVQRAEDQILRRAEDEPLPTPSAASSSLASRGTLRRRAV